MSWLIDLTLLQKTNAPTYKIFLISSILPGDAIFFSFFNNRQVYVSRSTISV